MCPAGWLRVPGPRGDTPSGLAEGPWAPRASTLQAGQGFLGPKGMTSACWLRVLGPPYRKHPMQETLGLIAIPSVLCGPPLG